MYVNYKDVDLLALNLDNIKSSLLRFLIFVKESI